ncbi:uncharacterized protein N7529_004593 [Penicillium soppii]|uniref:uncharacterized protein n=1 Tax=Penicillium soppii TaxID=69789 RepID=UPI0025481102|nr:uncharacterized protein N7529_004593 [Penicillium soppii]KAJ5872240.1 hypothetical protein N7529_004593 [Penicillium soppii]
MSNQSDRPWTEDDKYTLLTEILKKAGFPSSYLVRMIKEYGITPNWEHIPLPQGRSLSSCKTAYLNMVQQPAQPSHPVAPFPPRFDMTGPPTPMDPSMRKRPFYPSDKPVPRAIQPRPPASTGPPASTASYSSESGASAQLSPRLDTGEPPRKRGRPSKAETERRKLLAEARGEPYPAPRRSGSGRLKIPPRQPVPQAQAQAQVKPSAPTQAPSPMLYDSAMRSIPAPAEDRRDIPPRNLGSNMRELPRPTEMVHPLPSPHALQLGPPDAFPRLAISSPAERAYNFPPDRFSPSDSDRRDSVTSRPDQPGPYEGRMSTPSEKPPR